MHWEAVFRQKNNQGGRLAICPVSFFNFSLSAQIFQKSTKRLIMHWESVFRPKKPRWAIGDKPSQFFRFFAHCANFLKINQMINNARGKCI